MAATAEQTETFIFCKSRWVKNCETVMLWLTRFKDKKKHKISFDGPFFKVQKITLITFNM